MRSLRISVMLGAVIVAMTGIGQAVARAVRSVGDFALRLVLSIVPNQRPAFALGGPAEGFGGHIRPFDHLTVERHEAGTSRRAAARGI